MEIDFPDEMPREMNVALVQRSDGWRIQFCADTGDTWEQNETAFPTREAAQEMVNKIVEGLRVQYGATTMKPS